MVETKAGIKNHPLDTELSDLLLNRANGAARKDIEDHVASCDECLTKLISAYESVKYANMGKNSRKGNMDIRKSINPYIIGAAVAFLLSFLMPRYFMQFLVATILLGIKWIVDSKSTKMLIMIYEAWKNGGEKEATKILESFDTGSKKRF